MIKINVIKRNDINKVLTST